MTELVANLGLDWKLLLAQIVNFGVLAFVLTKFLYKPLLNALKERQKLAQETVDNADGARKALESVEQETKQKEQDARQKADQILRNTEAKAGVKREELVAKAEMEAQKIVQQARNQSEAERAVFFEETKIEIASLVVKAAEKVLEREVTKEDSKRLAQKALDELSSHE